LFNGFCQFILDYPISKIHLTSFPAATSEGAEKKKKVPAVPETIKKEGMKK